MDWSKAKNVMIIALLLTNIFLIYACVEKYYEKSAVTDNRSFVSALKQHGIIMQRKIPEGKDKLPILSLSYSDPSDIHIAELLKHSNFEVKNPKKNSGYENVANKFMEKLGFSMTDFFCGNIKQTGDIVKVPYLSTYDGYSIYTQPLYVVFKKGKISDLEGKIAIGVPASKRQISVISPEKALLLFMSEEPRNDKKTVIRDMQLVFWVNNEDVDENELVLDTAFPAWRIIYDDDEVRYIDANRV